MLAASLWGVKYVLQHFVYTDTALAVELNLAKMFIK
jgi:hypothetical protein